MCRWMYVGREGWMGKKKGGVDKTTFKILQTHIEDLSQDMKSLS